MSNKKLNFIYILSALLVISLPFFLEIFIFRNKIPSSLTNSDWSSFLGSYIGGILGSVGTLIAVYITTKETREIQKDTLQRVKEDRELVARNERKEFANQISEYAAKYISEISVYFYGCRTLERLNTNLRNAQDQLYRIECDIQNILEENQQNINSSHIESNIKKLEHKRNMQKYKIEIIERDIDKNKVNRLSANKYYYLLQMKLQYIDDGKSIIDQLEYIHENSSKFVEGISYKWIEQETEKLKNTVIHFMREYIDQKLF